MRPHVPTLILISCQREEHRSRNGSCERADCFCTLLRAVNALFACIPTRAAHAACSDGCETFIRSAKPTQPTCADRSIRVLSRRTRQGFRNRTDFGACWHRLALRCSPVQSRAAATRAYRSGGSCSRTQRAAECQTPGALCRRVSSIRHPSCTPKP